MSTNAQPLQGDNGPISMATNLVAAAVTLNMCENLAATIASPNPVAPAGLSNAVAGVAVLGAMKLAQKIF
jgi:hypothetical protein